MARRSAAKTEGRGVQSSLRVMVAYPISVFSEALRLTMQKLHRSSIAWPVPLSCKALGQPSMPCVGGVDLY